jgi:tetratricopeptide (TPR) repeat protein
LPQREIVDAFERLGDVLRAQGDLMQASQEYKSELAPLIRLASFPAGTDLKPRVWGLRQKIGDTLRMQGDLVQALTYYQSALSDLPTDDRRDLALSHDKFAQVMWLQGNRVQSLAELNAALTMWEGLASEQPGSVYWQVMRVVERSKIASATAAGQGAQAALLPDFILPASSERRLEEQDIAGLGREQLRLARNEIFARHGRYFKEPVLGGHFSQFLWYRPYTWLTDLTTDETANVNFLLSTEQQAKPSANSP